MFERMKVTSMSYKNESSDPFADFLWMGEMEDFDQQVEAEFQEQEFIKNCIEQLLDEEEEQTVFFESQKQQQQQTPSQQQPSHQQQQQNGYSNGYSNTVGGYSGQHKGFQQQNPQFQQQQQHQQMQQQNTFITRPYEERRHYQNGQRQNHYQHNNQNSNNFNPRTSQYVPQSNFQAQPLQPPPAAIPSVKSALNPMAVPFVMNPAAKEFVPRSFQPPHQQLSNLNLKSNST